MSGSAAPRRFAVVPLIATLLGVALFSGLGVWQVQRLHWKEGLLARIAALQTAPPQPLAVVLNRLGDHVSVDYTRVQTVCPALTQTATIGLYALNNDVIGQRRITACPLTSGPYRSILVDRGFVAEADAKRPLAAGPTDAPVIGVLRKGDAPTAFTPKHQPGGEWFGRDVPAMAAALGAPDPAPVFLMLERPKPAGFGPTPLPVPVDIPNNHLGYAITWFGLAAALAVFYAVALFRKRRG